MPGGDDLVEKVRRLLVQGQIPKFVTDEQCGFIANGTNLVLIGNPGAGKTFLFEEFLFQGCHRIPFRIAE